MGKTDHIVNHDKFADTYDQSVKEYHSFGHEIIFGMCYEYVKAGESLLDLGIGTGLSSVNFARQGLQVTGLDGSAEMLKQCKKKNFARELIQHDLQETPFPWGNGAFDHIICCGVLHFFGDLNNIFKEIGHLIKPGGIFAFTIASLTKSENRSGNYIAVNFLETPTTWGVPIFRHTDGYMQKLKETYGLEFLKEQKVLSDSGDPLSDDILFKVIISRKKADLDVETAGIISSGNKMK
jgi:predicted TPR repeat methyltransferase